MVSFTVRAKNLPGYMYNWGALWVPMDPKLPQYQSEYVLPIEEIGFHNVPDKGSLYIQASDGGWWLGDFWLGMFVEEGIGIPMVDGGLYEFDYSTKTLILVPPEEEEVPPEQYTVSISIVGQGTTRPAPGVRGYPDGEEVLVSAIPAAGWAFDHWEGDISGTDNPIRLLMTRDIYIVAVFSEVVIPPQEHAVSVSVIGEGTTDPLPGTYTIPYGTVLTITAYPADGWWFHSWEGTDNNAVNPTTVTMDSDRQVIVHFTQEVPEERRDPLHTFIRTMESMRPKCPIEAVEKAWVGLTGQVIFVTPAIKILPPG